MDVKDAVIVGHSFGGYLSAAYMLRKYDPESMRVRELVLASPVGVPVKPPHDPSRKLPASWRFVRYLWDSGMTPQAIVRAAGPWGKSLVKRVINARFGGETMSMRGVQSPGVLLNYMHSITVAHGSGEHALRRILLPGAYARSPLVSRLGGMPKGVPVTFLYGSHDWMTPVASLKETCAMHIIPNAGHHLYINNSRAFENHILNALKK